jgi:hypothetical protein
MPIDLSFFTMSTLGDNVFVFGGSTNHPLNRTSCYTSSIVYRFDGYNWTNVSYMHVPVQEHASARVNNDSVLICGGTKSNCYATDNCYIYNTISDVWSSGGNMSAPRRRHSMVAYNGWF